MINTQNMMNQNPFSYFPAPQMEIQKVSGEESARSFPMGPNSSVILLDTLNPLIWVVVTDSSGYKTVSPFTITPYIPEQPVTAADLKDQIGTIIDRLEKIEERMNANAQSDRRNKTMSRYVNLENAMCRELDKLEEKYRGGAEMSEGDLRRIDLLSHSLKSIRCYAEKIEAEESQRAMYENNNGYYANPNMRYMDQNRYQGYPNDRRW